MAAIERKDKNMKKQWKKTAALVMTLMLGVSLLSACGSSGSGAGGDGTDKSAEANAGVRGVVITIPDGWTVSGGQEDGYLSFASEDSDCVLSLSATNSADLEKNKEFDDSITTTDINEFYKKNAEEYEKAVKDGRMERSETSICGTDGYYNKSKNEKGYVSLDTVWLLDGNVYQLTFFDPDNGDFENESGIKDDPETLSDEDIAMFEAVMESAKAGDGAAQFKSLMATASIGEYTFTTPEGYKTLNFGENYVTLGKDGGKPQIIMSVTTEEDLKTLEDENGNHPASLEEEWKNRNQGLAEEDKTEIAGKEGFVADYPDENGKKYNIWAGFFGDDGIYNIMIDTDAWGTDGNIKEGAVELTEEDSNTFKDFVKTFKAK